MTGFYMKCNTGLKWVNPDPSKIDMIKSCGKPIALCRWYFL